MLLISALSFFLFTSCNDNNKPVVSESTKVKTDSLLFKDGALTKEIKIYGEVENQLLLTVDSLKSMDVFEGGEHQLVCRSGEKRKKINNFKGVLLKNILDKAKIKLSHKESGRYIVKITSTNNYVVTYALNEILYNETGNNVFVTFEENGEPITKDGGLMSIITLNDNVTGVRHVKWPKEIEIIKL